MDMLKVLSLMTLFLTSVASAQINKQGVEPARSRKEFCEGARNPDYVKSLFYSQENLIAFTNAGGLFDAGVCWWHSMLTRSAQHLAVYQPQMPKPGRFHVEKIIGWLSSGRGIVEIPGYHNFSEFTRDNQEIVQRALNNWQIGDGAFGLGFIRGLTGHYKVQPRVLSRMMDQTYNLVKRQNRIVYQKLQMKGIQSHAWLVIDMIKTEKGYAMDVVDSNYSSLKTIQYTRGMEQLPNYQSVPYTSRNFLDQAAYNLGVYHYCKRGMTAKDLEYAAEHSGN